MGRAARPVIAPDGTMEGLTVKAALDAARTLLPTHVPA
jgi:hypothetical protein